MAIVAIVAFVCGALFGGAATVLGILAYGMLTPGAVAGPKRAWLLQHPKRPRRMAKIPPRPERLELGTFRALPWPRL